jgi:hypothetical protein
LKLDFYIAGSFCFSVKTGANKSPCFSPRYKTWAVSNVSSFAFFFLKAVATSSHVTSVETVGCSFARSE